MRAKVDTRGASNMTEALASKTCTPCRGGIPPLTREQAELFHAQAPDWQLPEEAHRIERSFRFRNFREALTFVRDQAKVGPVRCPRHLSHIHVRRLPRPQDGWLPAGRAHRPCIMDR